MKEWFQFLYDVAKETFWVRESLNIPPKRSFRYSESNLNSNAPTAKHERAYLHLQFSICAMLIRNFFNLYSKLAKQCSLSQSPPHHTMFSAEALAVMPFAFGSWKWFHFTQFLCQLSTLYFCNKNSKKISLLLIYSKSLAHLGLCFKPRPRSYQNWIHGRLKKRDDTPSSWLGVQ